MLWKTHLRISFEVLNRLGISLSPEVTLHFKDGIIAPDQWKDYPHHYGKSENIKNYLMKSRRYFLKDDFVNAFFQLGVALHYIQDSYTSVVSYNSYNNERWHKKWEEDIETSSFTYDLEKTIQYSLSRKGNERNRCLSLAKALSEKAQGRDHTLYLATLSGLEPSRSSAKPIVDLNLALRASHVVTESVLSPKTCPALENKLRDDLSNHIILMVNSEKGAADKIIRLITERENLKKRKLIQSGIVCKIKNWILGIRISLKESAVNSNYRSYIQQKHLHSVITEYIKAANRTVAPYVGWNNFQIPQLNPSFVSKELLSVQEVAEALGRNEQTLQESLGNHNVSFYFIGDNELVRRQELDKYLSQVHILGTYDQTRY